MDYIEKANDILSNWNPTWDSLTSLIAEYLKQAHSSGRREQIEVDAGIIEGVKDLSISCENMAKAIRNQRIE